MFGHMSDNGGMVPGSIPIKAETIFHEGIRIPPTKLYKKGVCDQTKEHAGYSCSLLGRGRKRS